MVGTLLSVVLPAVFPQCHKYKECGCFFIENEHEKYFIEDSPDGMIVCCSDCKGANCRNPLELPFGKLSVEIKCPYTPIDNKTLLPVAYTLPYYYACQVLSHMKATDTDVLLFASASQESVSISLVDFSAHLWDEIYKFSTEIYGQQNCTKPTELQPTSIQLPSQLKDYSKNNTILIAEVPLSHTIDDERFKYSPMTEENLKCFRKRTPTNPSYIDWENINRDIVELCDESVDLIHKCNNLLRRKATEVLLFLATDVDRKFNKDIPISIPIAYALKGKSIRLETARQLINTVRDELKQNNISVLCEALDGQWAGLIFRDEIRNPLTLYEFDKECWQKFASKGKPSIINLMESYSHISFRHNEAFSKLQDVTEGHYKTGNIGVTITNEWRFNGKEDIQQKILYLYSFCGNLEEECGLKRLKTPSKLCRPDLWGLELGINGNLLSVLGLKPFLQNTTTPSDNVPLDMDDETNNLQYDIVAGDTENSLMEDTLPDYLSNVETFHEAEWRLIRRLLLTEHKIILEQILIILLCSSKNDKWSTYHINHFYDTCLSSCNNIFRELTSAEITTILNFLSNMENITTEGTDMHGQS